MGWLSYSSWLFSRIDSVAGVDLVAGFENFFVFEIQVEEHVSLNWAHICDFQAK